MVWKKGESGNPAGKPAGTGSTSQYRKLLESQAPDLIAAVIKAALSGDVAAQRLCLDRLLPVYKPQSIPIAYPVLPDGTLLDQARQVLSGMSTGTLPGESLAFLRACRILQELQHGETLENRIIALENSLQQTINHDTENDHDPDLEATMND